MSLPALLSELAALLPERVQIMEDDMPGWGMVRVQAEQYWHTVIEVFPTGHNPVFRCASAILEAGLREECEARGWTWQVEYVEPGNYWAHLDRPNYRIGFGAHGKPTPAEALAAAVLDALKAEKGEG